jgi:transposase-like protein
MEASLIAAVIDDAGSIRGAARVLGLPKSTLARWVQQHRERGTWPT